MDCVGEDEAMAPKTRAGDQDPADYVAALPEKARPGAELLVDVMSSATGEPAVMWGSIVGFGRYSAANGNEWMRVGFAVRGKKFALYGLQPDDEREAQFARLGPSTRGSGCVYLTDPSAADRAILTELVRFGYDHAGT